MMARYRFFALNLATFLLPVSLSHGITLSLTPIKDTVIYEDPTGSLANARGSNLFAGVNGGGGGNLELRTLISFDVSGIPSGSTITGVSLSLQANSRLGTSTTVQTNFHRLLGDWGEGTSLPSDGGGGSGGDATPGDATWIHTFSSTDLWDTPGGDFVASPSATLDVTENFRHTWTSPELVTDVQGFVDGDFDNFGWILIAEPGARTKRFFSHDSFDSIVFPQLIVDYTPIPEPGVTSIFLTLIIPALLQRRRRQIALRR